VALNGLLCADVPKEKYWSESIFLPSYKILANDAKKHQMYRFACKSFGNFSGTLPPDPPH